jgi:hypothetical protein
MCGSSPVNFISPSLATTFSIAYSQSRTPLHSGSFQNIGLSRLDGSEWLSIPLPLIEVTPLPYRLSVTSTVSAFFVKVAVQMVLH